jgi:alkylhydroperoxidase family enzyme
MTPLEDESQGGVMHGRLPWYSPSELTESQYAVYEAIVLGARSKGPQAFRLVDDEGRLEGPFNAMLVNPKVAMSVQAVGAAVRFESLLSDRAREIAILRLASLEQCDFEWYAHERVGLKNGLTEEELGVLKRGSFPSTFDPEEVLVGEVVTSLQSTRALSDELFSKALEILGLTKLADVITLVGYYQLLSLSVNAWHVPLPAGEVSPFA